MTFISKIDWSSRRVKWLLLGFLFVYLGLTLSVPIQLDTTDLGRHIKNGEVFFKNLRPITTNYYSYTEPDRYTVNHHWGIGIVYYLIWKVGGFYTLSIFNIVIALSTLFIFFKIAERRSNFKVAFFCSLLALPLIRIRVEVRPEILSYCLMGFSYHLYNRFQTNSISFKRLCLSIIAIQIIWVNMHIYFVIGLMITGIFWLDGVLSKRGIAYTNRLLALIVVAMFACLVNPYGWKGAVIPFTIFQNYGIQPSENLGIWIYWYNHYEALLHLFQSGFDQRGWLISTIKPLLMMAHYTIVFLVTSGCGIYFLVRRRSMRYLAELILFLTIGILGCVMNRAIGLLVYLFIPIGATFFALVYGFIEKRSQQIIRAVVVGLCFFWILPGMYVRPHYYSVKGNMFGLGLMPGITNGANFFKENKLEGPILNNFDIGSHLIFNLFPRERVFVDNRAEAYSEKFLHEVYMPMFQDERKWEEVDQKFNFNSIFMMKSNQSDEMVKFLLRRSKDAEWAVVFSSENQVILVKRIKSHHEVIEKYEIRSDHFRNIVHAARNRLSQGLLLASRGEVAMALEDFLAALKIDSDYVDAHYYLAHAHLYLGDLEMAINGFEKVLELDSGNAMAALEIGRIYLKESHFMKAAEYLDKAMRLKPDLREAHAALASLYERQGDYKKALIFNQNLLLLDDNNKLAKDYGDGFVRTDDVETSTR